MYALRCAYHSGVPGAPLTVSFVLRHTDAHLLLKLRFVDQSCDGGVPVRLPDGQRAGLFTRAGFLFSGVNEPNPVLRGARIRTEFLCANLMPPNRLKFPGRGGKAPGYGDTRSEGISIRTLRMP